MAITERETGQVDEANASGRPAVVFIHGLWLLPSSWDRWAALFEEAGYAPVTPVWPDDPETVEQARANPEVFARKTIGQIADHTAEVIGKLTRKPAVMGHSTGGLLAQMIAGRGLSAATVAIDPGPFRGVLPLPISALRSAMPVLKNPLNRGRAVTLTLDQFKYGWANALSDEEAKQLYETYHVAAPGVALIQMATANLGSEAKADTKPVVQAAVVKPAPVHRPVHRSNAVLNDSQIASIKRRLNLTPEQERYWPAVEAQLRKMEYKKDAKDAGDKASTKSVRLASVDMSKVDVDGLKTAGFPLVMSFSDDQRRELKSLAHLLGLESVISGF